MSKIWAMRGYSGSGKSTKAREIADANNAVVINRDLIRLMLLGSHWTGKKQDEDRVSIAEMAQVKAFLLAGTQVVIDATHLNPKYLRQWARLATRYGADFQVVDVMEDPDECKRRDHARMLAGGRYVGDTVIKGQVQTFPQKNWPTVTAEKFDVEPVELMPNLPEAIIVDIDGTLAHIREDGRSPYDYTRVTEDWCDPVVAGMLRDFKVATDFKGQVLIVSGRDHTCRNDTLLWLNSYGIHFDKLFMRDAERTDVKGNKLPDYMIKYEIFNKYIRGVYNVNYVLDDRKQVVDMWRRLGLKCLQVEDHDF